MKKGYLLQFTLIVVTVIGLGVLFYLPYQNVKVKTISSFNREQFLLVQQSASAIQNTFAMYRKGLEHLAADQDVASLTETGRAFLKDFYIIHTPTLLFAGRLDGNGKVLFRLFDPDAISEPELTQALASIPVQPPEPLVTDILGQDKILAAFSAPVSAGDAAGSVVFIISFDHLMSRFVNPLKADPSRRTWVINRSGIVLDCPNPDHKGAHITDSTKDAGSSTLLAVMQNMTTSGSQGAGTFILQDDQPDNARPVTNHVIFMPVTLPGGNYWSIAMANPEKLVLMNMKEFRNNWLLAAILAIFSLVLLSFFLIRAMAEAEEDKKRQRYEDQMVRLMDFTPIGIIVYDTKGKLLYANNTAKKMWQKNSEAELNQLNIFDHIHPDYKNFIGQRFKEVLRGNTSEPAIIKVLLPGNVTRSIEISTAPFQFSGQRGGVSVMQDVTQRLKSEEEQRLLATAMANTNDSILITDRAGNIEYVNPAFSRITGYTRAEAIGQNPRLMKSGRHDQAFYEEMWQTLRHGNVWEGRLINRKKDGTLFTELASISPVRDTAGKVTHYVAVKRDISLEVDLESQLAQAQKMEAIGTLAGGIAHDFNNILGAIIGFTDLSLQQLPPDSSVHDNLQHIRSSGKRAADLIQQILTFSRQTTQKDRVAVAITPLIKETLKLLRASIPTTIDIRFGLAEPEGWILADPVQIQQVIMNLCTNAFHAMSDHGGTLTITLRKLEGESALQNCPQPARSCLELQVGDTGIGIDQKIVERIFDPFFTTKAPGVGTGMGLSVVHGIIRDLQGSITVDSSPTGTTFTILLPETDPPETFDSQEERELPRGSGKILIVDDEEDIRETTRQMLEPLGYRVHVSTSARKALALVREADEPFDLIVTDQTMPEMTGTELIRELHHSHPDLPFIICTGYSEKVNEETAREHGARLLLKKPFTYQQLADAVYQVLGTLSEGDPA